MSLKSKIGTSERFNSITVEVKIKCDGAGMSAGEINEACKRIAKAANGRSRLRYAVAWCDDIAASAKGSLYQT